MAAKQVHNLTIPIYPYLPLGSVLPWESVYWTEDIATIERNVAHLFYISMGSETGTRLMGPGLTAANATKIADLPLQFLVNRQAAVVPLAKGAGEAISADDVRAAFMGAEHLRPGDALIIATGWGDGKRWKELGEKYALESPYFTPDAAAALVELMEQNGIDFLLTDCAYLGRIGAHYARTEWVDYPSWLRPAWPSDQAKAYVRRLTAEMVKAEFEATLTLVEKVWAVAGLAECGGLGARRVRLTVLPMFVQDAGEAPCTVVVEL